MRRVEVNFMDWLKYADSVTDINFIHRFDAAAKKYDLQARVAPGMWLASQIQGREPISSIRSIKFSGSVYDGEEVIIEDSSGIMGQQNYIFRRGDDVVCDIKGVRFGRGKGEGKPLREILHVYQTEITPGRLQLFLESIGRPDLSVPDMYLASLAAPALLDFGYRVGMTGLHLSQTFESHAEYRPGPVEVAIGDRRDRGQISSLELRMVQGNKIVASSQAGVLLLAA